MPFGRAMPIDDAVKLVPVYDPALRTFSVQLWKSGAPAGIHGLIEDFTDANKAVESINAFLQTAQVRELTNQELSDLGQELVLIKG
ncbi:hypothetical protein [Streptomyces chartreusis]|uniref:Uncharacterized protein n=1 Tax=Streptomyces chartreusis TaxID=1969 RepID=A0A7H8TK04_STRCX|nr:hypothetical protein [Streptomyces chartreusis]QKZ23846.1 hypothetical protein HUT05_44715 [Streptomyces chartreusis]